MRMGSRQIKLILNFLFVILFYKQKTDNCKVDYSLNNCKNVKSAYLFIVFTWFHSVQFPFQSFQ